MKRFMVAGCAVVCVASCTRTLPPTKPGPLFRDIAYETGLVFRHVNGAAGQFYMPEIMGAGAALFDYDGDGDLDVFLVQGGPLAEPARGSSNRLFQNQFVPSGKLRFEDVTEASGLLYAGYGMGAAVADINRDGHPDLLVTNFGPNVLYRNTGNGTFTDVTAESPAVRREDFWSSSASFFDYDRDGWQDLLILSYVDFSVKANKRCSASTGEPDYCTPLAYRAVAARLFHNQRGRFADVTAVAGIDRARGPGLGVAAVDADRDGWPDLFVANDTAQNHLWLNRRNGTFAEVALERGVAYGDDGQPKAGMGVAAGDFDNDGDEDLVVLNLRREGASLFRNDRTGSFTDVSLSSRIHALTLPYTGFGVGWLDFDNDGCLDLFLANGAVTLPDTRPRQGSAYSEKSLLLRGSCGARPFEDVSATAGGPFDEAEVRRGAAFGDLDNDGRIDIVVTTNNGPVRLLHNEAVSGNWLTIVLPEPGARVGLVSPEGRTLWRRGHPDGSYLSASDTRVHFGLGTVTRIDKLLMEWPDNHSQEEPAPRLNSIISVRRHVASGAERVRPQGSPK